MPTRKVIDRNTVKLSGATNCTAIAPSGRQCPLYMAETPKASDCRAAVLIPIAPRGMVVADREQRPPDPARDQVAAMMNANHRDGERKKYSHWSAFSLALAASHGRRVGGFT